MVYHEGIVWYFSPVESIVEMFLGRTCFFPPNAGRWWDRRVEYLGYLHLYVRPHIRKSPVLELALPVLVRVPVLVRAYSSIPVLVLAPFLQCPYAQTAISRKSTTRFVPVVRALPPGRHLRLSGGKKKIKFYFRTKRHTRKNSSLS